MSKKVSTITRLAVCLALLVMSVAALGYKDADAAAKVTKKVYNLSQYKKAVKNSKVGTIIYMTNTSSDVVIPASSKAKKKNLEIYCDNSRVTNNAKFKSVSVRSARSYTENATGNTIDIYGYEIEFEVKEGKTVKKLTFRNFNSNEMNYTLRKGAKISNIVVDNYGTVSKLSKDKTITMEMIGDEDSDVFGTVKFTFDDDGRYKKMYFNNKAYKDERTVTYTYDENGNKIKEYISSDYSYYIDYKYDKDNNLIEYSDCQTDGRYNYGYSYEYDSNGNCIKKYEKPADGSKELLTTYKYDKYGKQTEIKMADNSFSETYKYDSKGCLTRQIAKRNGKLSSDIEYFYDKNCMLSEYKISYEEGLKYNYVYVRDEDENIVYVVSRSDNILDYAYFEGETDNIRKKYEDGFVSPVDPTYGYVGGTTDAALKKNGYTVVSSAEQLINAIKPGAKIIIKAGVYNLSEYLQKLWNKYGEKWNDEHKYVKLLEEYDGIGLEIKDCDNLLISGGAPNAFSSEITVDPRYCAVFTFTECDDLTLCNMTLGHTDRGDCSGNVIDLYNCNNVNLYTMDIYGCGVYGIGAYENTSNVTVYNSELRDCEYGPFEIENVKGNFKFVRCAFIGSAGGGYFYTEASDGKLTFESCAFGAAESNKWYFKIGSDQIIFNDCLFSEVTDYPEYGF